MKRDIKRDREELENARRYNYNASTWDQTMEQSRRVKELIEEAFPYYLSLYEHQQRMLDAAITFIVELGECPPDGHKACRAIVTSMHEQPAEPPLDFCIQCIRDYLDTKAKEASKVKEHERLIICNCTKLPMKDVLDMASAVVGNGRQSGDGTCYCYLTAFKNGVACSANLNKKSDTLTFYDDTAAKEGEGNGR